LCLATLPTALSLACRLDARFVLVNATTVVAHQELVQYLIYWQIMSSSSDPAMRAEAAWMQRGPGITVWEVGAGQEWDGYVAVVGEAHVSLLPPSHMFLSVFHQVCADMWAALTLPCYVCALVCAVLWRAVPTPCKQHSR
jgi:hypothetical protein